MESDRSYSHKNALKRVNSELRLLGINLSVNVQEVLFKFGNI